MIRLYTDEDSGQRIVVRALRERGVDVLTAHEAKTAGFRDPDQLAFATSAGRTLITANVGDFSALHWRYLSVGRQHAGIVIMLQDMYKPGEQIRRLERLARAHSPEQIANALVFLQDWGDDRER